MTDSGFLCVFRASWHGAMVQLTSDSLEGGVEGIHNYACEQGFNLTERGADKFSWVYFVVQYDYQDTSIRQKDTTMFDDKLSLTVRDLGDGQLVCEKKKRPSGGLVNLTRKYDSRDENEKEKLSFFCGAALAAAVWGLGQCADRLCSLVMFLIWVLSLGHIYSARGGAQRRKRGGSSGRNCPTATLLFFYCLLLCCVHRASGSKLRQTKQVLPEACLEWFTVDRQDCPVKVESGKEWADLNSICCSAFPGTVLHCQRGYFTPAKLGQYSFPACLADEKVPAGHAVKLEVDSAGMPRLIQVPCSSNKFENKARKSSDVTFQYCTETRSSCSGEGQEKLCLGNPTSDDRCTCRAGYRSHADHCLPSFTDNDPCMCKVMSCPPGQCAARTPAQLEPGTCSDLKLNGSTVQFICTPCPTSPASVAPPVTSSTDIKGTGSVDTAPPTPFEKPENSTTPVGTLVKPVAEMGAGYKLLFFLFIGFQVMVVIAVVASAVLFHYPAH